MSEWLRVLERLRVLAVEWTGLYNDTRARIHHISYLQDTIDRIHTQPLTTHQSRLLYEQTVQTERQTHLIHTALKQMSRVTRELDSLAQTAESLPLVAVDELPRAQRVTGVTSEYVLQMLRGLCQTCASEYKRVVRLAQDFVRGRFGVRRLAELWLKQVVALDMHEMSDRLRAADQILRFERMAAEIRSS